jgi:hypothetical protein
MNVQFQTAGELVECKVTINVPFCGPVAWTFAHKHSDKYYAALACYQMQNELGSALQAMRQDAYEQGWKDAKAHKGGKCEWFSRNFKP